MPLPKYQPPPLPRYETIPVRPDECTTAEQWRLFWEYGNYHDGPCGEFIPAGLHKDNDGFAFGGGMRSQEHFERWHRRNPGHNKDFIRDRKPVIAPRYVYGAPKPKADGTIDFREEMNNTFVLRHNPFFMKVGPVIYGYRSDKPPWPAPVHGYWYTLGPNGGARDRGIKNYRFTPEQPSPSPLPPVPPIDKKPMV